MYENKKILIVDDEEHSRLYLANILHELFPEIQVHLASSPHEALFIIGNIQFDVIMLDVEMPGMSGHELAKQLNESLNLVPVVFVSAYSNVAYVKNALRLNAIDYLDKPVDPEELRIAIIKSLEKVSSNSFNENPEIDRLCLLTQKGDLLVYPDEIVCVLINGRYSKMQLLDGTLHLLRDNLETMSKKLNDKNFLRVSRQAIANKKLIKMVSKSNKTITLQWNENSLILNKIFPCVLIQLINVG